MTRSRLQERIDELGDQLDSMRADLEDLEEVAGVTIESDLPLLTLMPQHLAALTRLANGWPLDDIDQRDLQAAAKAIVEAIREQKGDEIIEVRRVVGW